MMTDTDKLTVRGEIWLGFGDVTGIGDWFTELGQTKSTAHLRE